MMRVKMPGFRAVFVLLVVGAAGVGACDLNPQPIPPGEQADGGNEDFGGGGSTGSKDASTNNPTPGDAGTGQDLDGAPRDDDGGDAATEDAGEDAGDAEADADAM